MVIAPISKISATCGRDFPQSGAGRYVADVAAVVVDGGVAAVKVKGNISQWAYYPMGLLPDC